MLKYIVLCTTGSRTKIVYTHTHVLKVSEVPESIDLFVEEVTAAEALAPARRTLVSVAEKLKERGLALAKRDVYEIRVYTSLLS